MKAIGLTRYLPIEDPDSLQDLSVDPPASPQGQDILVQVQAVSVNPVDTKLRAPKAGEESPARILGFDAAGTVVAVGPEVTAFEVGDEVYYAGDVTRPGCDAQLQLVDERLVGRKPTTLDFAEAAALPLTTLTAWELLVERMPLLPQLQALGIDHVQVALNLADTDHYWDELGELLAPQGHVGLIVEPRGPLRIGDPYKAKCIGIHWEFMFARARFATADRIEQHRILNRAASMIDAGQLRGTLSEVLGPINAANLEAAHQRLASGRTIGKLALAGWDD